MAADARYNGAGFLIYLIFSNHLLPIVATRVVQQQQQQEQTVAEDELSLQSRGEIGVQDSESQEICNWFSKQTDKTYRMQVELGEKGCNETGECMSILLVREKADPILQFYEGTAWTLKAQKSYQECAKEVGEYSRAFASKNSSKCKLQWALRHVNKSVAVQNSTFDLKNAIQVQMHPSTEDDPQRLVIIDKHNDRFELMGGVWYQEDYIWSGMQQYFQWSAKSRGMYRYLKLKNLEMRDNRRMIDFEYEPGEARIPVKNGFSTRRGLLITNIFPVSGPRPGVLASWNLEHEHKDEALRAGDLIIAINGEKEPSKLALWIQQKAYLKNFEIMRPTGEYMDADEARGHYEDSGTALTDTFIGAGVDKFMEKGFVYGFGGGAVVGGAAAGLSVASSVALPASIGLGTWASTIATGAVFGMASLGFPAIALGIPVGVWVGYRNIKKKNKLAKQGFNWYASEKIFSKLNCMTHLYRRCHIGKVKILVKRSERCPKELL